MMHYWIPEDQLFRASTPASRDKGVEVKPVRRDMWLNGYDASLHHIYVGISKTAVSRATLNSQEYRGSVLDGSNVIG